LAGKIDALVTRRAGEEFPPPPVKEAIRAMLRRGGFKPSGRNKPASEYLAQAAREGRFPRINNLVDINNLLSLESGLPISLLDLDAVGEHAELRYGREGESYVFNAAGQEIDLKGLVCVCCVGPDRSAPMGNPIKDSIPGKLKDDTRSVIGVIYASRAAIGTPELNLLATAFGELLKAYGAAQSTEVRVLP
jgi:DNA/RNA-binding domain of Phe-tRNA-synthetase-like protein